MTDRWALYVWGVYAMGAALLVIELLLLRVRDRAIRGHLGWKRGYPRTPPPRTRTAPRRPPPEA